MSGLVIGKPIASGSYAVVRTARKVDFPFEYALKTLPKSRHDMSARANADMIRRETEHWKTVTGSPHVCELKEVMEDADNVYFLAELCQGGSLRDRLLDGTSATKWDDTVEIPGIAYQLTRAIHACHSKGVAHCDVKASNVLMKIPWRYGILCKLGDFGSSLSTRDPSLFLEDTHRLGHVVHLLLCDKRYETPADLDAISNPHARSFLRLLLCEDMDAASALSHPWFKRVPSYLMKI
jgi:serine/threonine protein kinase